MVADRREPTWSGVLTRPLSGRIPERWRPATLAAIKTAHTVIFLFALVWLALAVFTWDGVRQRPGRRTSLAAVVALAETAVYASNNQVCPLTPLAEELGAASGTVTDIFLPDWASRRIPVASGGTLVVGLVLNLRAWRRRRIAPAA